MFTIKQTTLLFGLFIIAFSACSPKTYNTTKQSDDRLPFTIDCQEYKVAPFDKTETSLIGNLTCDELQMVYDQDSYAYAGPKSNMEDFLNSYNAYHYSRILEGLKIEEKLWPMFKDSVEIINVYEGQPKKKAIVECENCNMTAELVFKNNRVDYPYMAKANDESGYEIIAKKINGDSYRWYFAKSEGQQSGLSITSPNGNLSITSTQKINKPMKKALMSIRKK